MTKISLPHWFQAFWWLLAQKGLPDLKGLRRILRASNFEAARPLLAKLSAAIAFRDGVQNCSEARHCTVAGHELIIAPKPTGRGKYEVRLHVFEQAGRMDLHKYLRSRLGYVREAKTSPDVLWRILWDAAGAAPAGAAALAPFPMKPFLHDLQIRLLAAQSITPPQLNLMLNLYAFQWSHRDLSAGELWRAALRFALRPVRGRGMPPWPPPRDQWP